jgi:hypothetical protein
MLHEMLSKVEGELPPTRRIWETELKHMPVQRYNSIEIWPGTG